MPVLVNAKKWVEANRTKLDHLIGHTVTIRLNGVVMSTDTTLQAMQPALIGELENPPEKRPGEGEKQYTPPCFALIFDKGRLVFAIEDTNITTTIREGVLLAIGDTRVEIEASNASH